MARVVTINTHGSIFTSRTSVDNLLSVSWARDSVAPANPARLPDPMDHPLPALVRSGPHWLQHVRPAD